MTAHEALRATEPVAQVKEDKAVKFWIKALDKVVKKAIKKGKYRASFEVEVWVSKAVRSRVYDHYKGKQFKTTISPTHWVNSTRVTLEWDHLNPVKVFTRECGEK